MGRRRFLKLLLGVFGSTAVLSFLYPIVRFFAPPAGEAKISSIILSRSEIPIGRAKTVVYGNTPTIVINHASKGLMAFSRVCTHLGCLVDYNPTTGTLICPCHAGTFDLEGNVISGPPPRPLPKLPLRVEGNTIAVG